MRFLTLFILFAGISAQAQVTTFQRTFPTADHEFAGDVIELSNGDFLLSGHTESFGQGNEDCFAVRTNSAGNPIWANTYGDTATQHFIASYALPNNELLLTGYTASQGNNGEDAILVKLDGSGNVLWSKAYGGTGDEVTRAILPAATNGFYVLGTSTSNFGAGIEDFYLLRVDAAGNLLWDKTYGGSGEDVSRRLRWTVDSALVIVGWTDGFGEGNKDLMAFKTDTSGNVLWANTYGSTKSERLQDVVVTTGGDFVGIGHTRDLAGASLSNPLMVKIAANGNQMWLTVYDDSLASKGLTLTHGQGGGFLAGGDGWIKPGIQDTAKAFVIKTDDNGNFEWSKTYGGGGDDRRPNVYSTADGGYAILTYTTSFISSLVADVHFIKTDSAGTSNCNEVNKAFSEIDTMFQQASAALNVGTGSTETTLNWSGAAAAFVQDTLCENIVVTTPQPDSPGDAMRVYPNPTTGKFRVESLEFEVEEVQVFDLFGRSIPFHFDIQNSLIDIRHSPAGIYFVRVGEFCQKVVLSKKP